MAVIAVVQGQMIVTNRERSRVVLPITFFNNLIRANLLTMRGDQVTVMESKTVRVMMKTLKKMNSRTMRDSTCRGVSLLSFLNPLSKPIGT
jgi:hypothetical protein